MWHAPLFYIGKRWGRILCDCYKVLGGSFDFLQSQVLNLDIQTRPCVRVDLRVNADGSQKWNTQLWYISAIIKKIKYPVSINNRGFFNFFKKSNNHPETISSFMKPNDSAEPFEITRSKGFIIIICFVHSDL